MNTAIKNLEDMPVIKQSVTANKLNIVYLRAKSVLNSPINSLQIAEGTGINHSSVMRLRKPDGNQGHVLEKATFGTLLCLANYFPSRVQHSEHLSKKQDIGLACVTFGIDPNEYEAMIATVFMEKQNVSELSREIHIPRLKLSGMKHKKQNIFSQHLDILQKMVSCYYKIMNR